MDQLATIESRLASLNGRIEIEQRKVHEEFSSEELRGLTPHESKNLREQTDWAEIRANQGYRAELLQVLDELARLYLDATPAEHLYIRSMVADKREVLQALNSYIYRALDKFESDKDPKWLFQALASVAIEDLRFDYRDTLIALGEFFVAAADAGIDLLPYLREVGSISSSDPGHAGWSTQRLLYDFDKTEYFQGTVRRRLKR